MRKPLFAVVIAAGAVVGLSGSRPLWLPAAVALLAFPVAASVALDISSRHRRARAPLLAATLAALSGGLIVALAVRLAVLAPSWLSASSADCGAASTEVQQLVFWSAAALFAATALPVALTLLSIGRRLEPGGSELGGFLPLKLFPVAVVASGIALMIAGFAVTC